MTDARTCLDLLRTADPDRYLACLWLRGDWRDPISALYAFNAEITRIPSLVSEPAPGEIRLQWWREVIGDERESGDHPVAVALLKAIERHDLPVASFDAYLEARIFDLYHDPMPDRAMFEAYAGETASALLVLAAQCAGAERSTQLADACGHGGVAQIVAAVLRALPMHRRMQRCYIPADILTVYGLNARTWLDEKPDERHLNVLIAMTAWGHAHLEKSRGAISGLPVRLKPVFLPLATVGTYLERTGRKGLRVLSEPLDISPLGRQFLFARAALLGR